MIRFLKQSSSVFDLKLTTSKSFSRRGFRLFSKGQHIFPLKDWCTSSKGYPDGPRHRKATGELDLSPCLLEACHRGFHHRPSKAGTYAVLVIYKDEPLPFLMKMWKFFVPVIISLPLMWKPHVISAFSPFISSWGLKGQERLNCFSGVTVQDSGE